MPNPIHHSPGEHSLDPADWRELREQGHRMLDDMLDYAQHLRERPVWQPIPDALRQTFREPLPAHASPLASVHESFMRDVLPYTAANAHPGFMGWVQGGGTPVGMLAEMLAAGLNANLGGRDQIPLEVERQVLQWVRELFGFPADASGLFVTGTSMANLIGVLVARTAALGRDVRTHGVTQNAKRLVAYTSTEAHECVAQAMDLCGLGTGALRTVAVNSAHQIDIIALEHAISADIAAGFTPFFVAGTAGSVNAGAIDDLAALADLAQRHGIWFHVDGAYGALAMLAPDLAPLLAGISRADSIAFDFHKWGQVPYDAGFVLVRDGRLHQETFAGSAAYLGRDTRGMAAGSPWPCDFGPDLSRGFKALKTWFTLKVYGAEKLGQMISGTCALARGLEQRIVATPELELLAPVALNIVCFRYRCEDSDQVNRDIVVALQESGVCAPSSTRIGGRLAIRAALFNHRTTTQDTDSLVSAAIAHGRALTRTPAPCNALRLSVSPIKPRLKVMENMDTRPSLMGLATLMRMVFSGADTTLLSQQLLTRAANDGDDANALMDLSILLHLRFNHELASALQAQALQVTRAYSLDAARPPRIRLLALMSPGDLMTNAPLEFLLENSDVTLHMQYLVPGRSMPESLPAHDVVFVAVGESAATRELLNELEQQVTVLPAPVLNLPQHVLKTSRDAASELLAGAPGIVMPVTARISRSDLDSIGQGQRPPGDVLAAGDFPLIVRPLDSHAGRGLKKLESRADIADYLASMADEDFYLSPFVDYRSADGLFRKFRVVLIDGKPYAGHMAISGHWMIHYLNADMSGKAEHRAEEAHFMEAFDTGFARRHAHSLRAISRRIGLDYMVIDCAETGRGDLLVFEVDSGAVVHAMDSAELFPYKQPQMQKVFTAFRAMLAGAVARHREANLALPRTGT
jgi:aromatic-L-amino-acid/L-tryptophan decarboxylase